MHKPKTLLARAKSITKKVPVGKPIDKQAAALSVAWALGEVTYTQAQSVLARSRGASVYAVLACGLRDALRLGMLQPGVAARGKSMSNAAEIAGRWCPDVKTPR